MATYNGFTYLETYKSPRSPSEAFGNNASQCDRTYLIRWDDRGTQLATGLGAALAYQNILGYPTLVPAAGGLGGYISRVLPMPNTEWTNGSNKNFLFATSIPRSEPLGKPDDGIIAQFAGVGNLTMKVARYKYSLTTIRFETLTYDILDDAHLQTYTAPGIPNPTPDESSLQRYVTKIVQPGGEYLALPYGSFKIVRTGTPPVPGQPGKIVPAADLFLTWHQVPIAAVGMLLYNPNLVNPAIDLSMGRINALTFAGCAPGTLLCMTPKIVPIRSAFGDRIVDVEYHFKFFDPKPQLASIRGWNTIYWAEDSGYREVSVDGIAYPLTVAGVHQYDSNGMAADFAALFRPST
jgi:hypothetical protein